MKQVKMASVNTKSSAPSASTPLSLSTTATKTASSISKCRNKQPIKSTKQEPSRDSDVSSSTKSTIDTNVQVAEKKRLPPIKAPVGLVKGPDLKNCKSKVGSLNNIKHTPAGGGVTIASQKLNWNAKSKVGSLENKEHKPGGGKLKVESQKLEWKTTSKVHSLQNVKHKPGGGNVKIFNDPSYVDKKEISQSKSNSASNKTSNGAKKETSTGPTSTTTTNNTITSKSGIGGTTTTKEKVTDSITKGVGGFSYKMEA